MPSPKHSIETKALILKAASQLFGKQGFRATTIAQICQMAGTNIASVNYHFGDKEQLYVEAWREAFRYSHEKHPLDGGVSPQAPAAERLHGWIASWLRRTTDPQCYDFEMAHREMVSPTGLLYEPIRQAIEPLRRQLKGIVGELLGEGATDEDVQLCEMSIRSQCMNPMILGKRWAEGEQPDHPLPKPPVLESQIDVIAQHVSRFCLAGMEAVHREIQTRPAPHPPEESHHTSSASIH